MSGKAYHIGIGAQEVGEATLALLPGDPDRVPRMAAALDEARPLGQHREFTSWKGVWSGREVLVCSTGIGGPSTSICVEELAQLGIRQFIRVGTTGSIQEKVPVGAMVITQAAVRLDGASLHFAPLAFPAVADFQLTKALWLSAQAKGIPSFVGTTASSDTFYPGQERYDTHAGWVPRHLQGSLKEWQRLGVLNYEMEAATLFTMAAALGIQAACIGGVIAQRQKSEQPVSAEVIRQTEDQLIDVAVGALSHLELP